ncbi:hypothetical protein ALO95_200408 [Pseudomonas syringae pv. antirrhini]|nr:hypothetical protein ALO95_200408 [Pseudomonas syringae pv. antirrhini]
MRAFDVTSYISGLIRSKIGNGNLEVSSDQLFEQWRIVELFQNEPLSRQYDVLECA